MNDVKKGIFEIDGVEISRDTKIEDILNSKKMKIMGDDDDIPGLVLIQSGTDKVKFIEGNFFMDCWFSEKKLERIVLIPYLDNIECPNYPDLEYQKISWDYCCDLLIKQFGEPDYKSEAGIKYYFDNGYLNCYQILDGRNEGEGGNIEIEYKN